MPVTQFNRIGLSYQPIAGSLILDSDEKKIEYQDNKTAASTILISNEYPLAKATWSEAGKEGSLQLYLQGYEVEDMEEVSNHKPSEEGGGNNNNDGDDNNNTSKTITPPKPKPIPKFYRIHGFANQDEETVRNFLQEAFNINLESESWDVRGANFGELKTSKLQRCVVFNDFETKSKPSIQIPLANVSQVAVPSKNEVEIQYTFSTTGPNNGGKQQSDRFELSVVRLFVPSTGENDNETNEYDIAEEWRKKMKDIADLYDEGDEASLGLVCNIDEDWCNFTAPRGKHRVDVYKDFFRMRGKTYDHKIAYSTMQNMHLLDHPEGDQKFLVISLNQPVKYGQTRYGHLVMTIDDVEDELKLIPSNEELASRYPDANLTETMKGKMPEQIAKLLKTCSGKKVYVMPSNGFLAAKEDGVGGDDASKRDRCVRCAYKANQGYLFPMKSSMIFLHKPVLYIRYEKIEGFEFKRNTSDSKTFDIEISMADTEGGLPKVMEFVQIPKIQFEPLKSFLIEQTKVPIRNKKAELASFFARDVTSIPGEKKKGQTILDFGSEDDDEEEDDSEFDAEQEHERKKTLKKTQKKGEEGGKEKPEEKGDDDDDDDDDSSDSEGGSTSDSSETDSSEDSDMAEEVSMDDDEVIMLNEEDVKQSKKKSKSTGDSFIIDDTKKKKKKNRDESDEEDNTKSKKKKKDPNAPKGVRSAFLFFSEKIRGELAGKGLSFAEMSAKVGELWKNQTDKSEFEALAAKDKKRYEEEMAKYKPSHNDSDEDEESGKKGGKGSSPSKKKKDKNAPKGARNAFNFFGDEKRAELKAEGLGFGEMSKRISEMWKVLPDSEKQPYNELASKDRDRYKKEMEAYQPGSSSNKGSKKRTTSTTTTSKKKKPKMGGGELPSESSSSDDDSSPDDDAE